MSDWKRRIQELRETLADDGVTRESLFPDARTMVGLDALLPALPPELAAERAMAARDAEALFRARSLLRAWLHLATDSAHEVEALRTQTHAELNR